MHRGGGGRAGQQAGGAATQPCKNFLEGHCTYGDRCRFSHAAAGGRGGGFGQQRADLTGGYAAQSQGAGFDAKPPCKNFMAGHCSYGDSCKFSHGTPQATAGGFRGGGSSRGGFGATAGPFGSNAAGPTPTQQPCKNFLAGNCSYGDRCKYSHAGPVAVGGAGGLGGFGREVHGGRAAADAGGPRPPCKNFLAGRCTYGDSCKYSHAPQVAFASGAAPRGVSPLRGSAIFGSAAPAPVARSLFTAGAAASTGGYGGGGGGGGMVEDAYAPFDEPPTSAGAGGGRGGFFGRQPPPQPARATGVGLPGAAATTIGGGILGGGGIGGGSLFARRAPAAARTGFGAALIQPHDSVSMELPYYGAAPLLQPHGSVVSMDPSAPLPAAALNAHVPAVHAAANPAADMPAFAAAPAHSGISAAAIAAFRAARFELGAVPDVEPPFDLCF